MNDFKGLCNQGYKCGTEKHRPKTICSQSQNTTNSLTKTNFNNNTNLGLNTIESLNEKLKDYESVNPDEIREIISDKKVYNTIFDAFNSDPNLWDESYGLIDYLAASPHLKADQAKAILENTGDSEIEIAIYNNNVYNGGALTTEDYLKAEKNLPQPQMRAMYYGAYGGLVKEEFREEFVKHLGNNWTSFNDMDEVYEYADKIQNPAEAFTEAELDDMLGKDWSIFEVERESSRAAMNGDTATLERLQASIDAHF